METNELKEYLKDVYELSSRVYSSQQIVATYQNCCDHRCDLRDEEGMNAIFEKYGGMTLDSGEVIQYADFSEYEEQLNQKAYSEAVNTGRFKFGKKLFGVGLFVLGIGIVGLIILLISICKAEGLLTAIFIGFILLALLVGVVNFFMNASNSMEEKARQKAFERILELKNKSEVDS